MFFVTLLAYLPCARYDFVEFDDTEYVVANRNVTEGLTLKNVKWAFSSRGYAFNWHPVTWLSLMADASLLKGATGCATIPKEDLDYDGSRLSALMHVHNVILHAANATLLFWLMAQLVGRRISDLWLTGISLLWAIHPLRVEAVCWVAERKELLACCFMLLALLAYTRKSGDGPIGWTIAFVSSALAMMAKPVAVTLPIILWTWDWLFRGKVRFARFVPFVALSALTCILTLQSQTEAMAVGNEVPVVSRVAASLVTPLVYIRQTLWPVNLSVVYEATDRLNWVAVCGGAVLVLIMGVVCVLRLRTRSRGLDLAVLAVSWVYVGLLPMLGIVKVGCQEHNDRYTYWVGCGVSVVASLVIVEILPVVKNWMAHLTGERMAEEWRGLRKMLLGAFALVLAVLCLETHSRMPCWRNTITLFRDAIPKCWSTEIAKILALRLVPYGPDGIAEGEMHLRNCADNHPNVLAAQKLAEFLLLFKDEDPLILRLGGETYAEAEGLIKGILAVEPERKRAKELLKILAERRGQK